MYSMDKSYSQYVEGKKTHTHRHTNITLKKSKEMITIKSRIKTTSQKEVLTKKELSMGAGALRGWQCSML